MTNFVLIIIEGHLDLTRLVLFFMSCFSDNRCWQSSSAATSLSIYSESGLMLEEEVLLEHTLLEDYAITFLLLRVSLTSEKILSMPFCTSSSCWDRVHSSPRPGLKSLALQQRMSRNNWRNSKWSWEDIEKSRWFTNWTDTSQLQLPLEVYVLELSQSSQTSVEPLDQELESFSQLPSSINTSRSLWRSRVRWEAWVHSCPRQWQSNSLFW